MSAEPRVSLRSTGPPVVCVVGKKNSGKTTFAVALARELTGRGRRVMTAKHGHSFDLDTPGTDSWRHRHEGGALRVALVGPREMAVMGAWDQEEEPSLAEVVARHLADAEIVVAEGWKGGGEAKIEIFRRSEHDSPVFEATSPGADSFLAIITDDPTFRAPVPVFSLDDPARVVRVADLVEKRLLGSPGEVT